MDVITCGQNPPLPRTLYPLPHTLYTTIHSMVMFFKYFVVGTKLIVSVKCRDMRDKRRRELNRVLKY